MSVTEQDLQLLLSIGLSEQKARETLKNVLLTKNLKLIVEEISKHEEIRSVNGNLVYHLACKIKSQIVNRITFLAKYIASNKLNTTQKIDFALQFLSNNIEDNINVKQFEEYCGVNIIVTPEEIEKHVEKAIKRFYNEIKNKRHNFNKGLLMQDVRTSLKFADGKTVKSEIDVQLFDMLGSIEEIEMNTISNVKPVKSEQTRLNNDLLSNSIHKKVNQQIKIEDIMKTKINFHKPGENYKTEGYVVTSNTLQLLNQHLLTTKGEVRTRFPPEPNGILHIGHAKAININFGYAAAFEGSCYLRYDDTNPEKEEEKFFTGILDIVKWLGYKPAKITYSSDYFDILFTWAVCLIKKDLAYVCHQSSDDIKGYNPKPSSWRNRPISESLRLFQDMKNGLLNEGEATLRMKVTLEEGKQDPVAYRIKYSYHHRTKREWCIYPTYDFTHCLCDSIENITHSLCTKEFQSRRSSYYWLCNALDIYCPVQWEYGRLNVSHTVISKRKIAKLIEKKIVNDWDDPRLYTLSALRRRGFPSEAINNFCAQMGVTGAQSIVDPSALEAAVRDYLNITAPRYMVVSQPLKLVICNYYCIGPVLLNILDFPGETDKGKHSAVYDRVIYIDSSDFLENADKSFKRLTINQSVGLKYAGVVIKVEKIIKNIDGSIVNLIVSQEIISDKNKPRAFIQWVSQPKLACLRLYEKLFQHRNPEDTNEVPNGFLSDINCKSKKEIYAYIDKNFEKTLKPFQKYQFERIGFFSVDPDTKFKKITFNRTVTLKESAWKV